MNEAVIMKELNPRASLYEVMVHLCLGESQSLIADEEEEIPSVSKLKYQIDVFFIFEGCVKLNDIRVFQNFVNVDLPHQGCFDLFVRETALVNLFDGKFDCQSFVNSQLNVAISTFPEPASLLNEIKILKCSSSELAV